MREFNPFNGHKYLLDQAEGLKIVAMFKISMQRGEPGRGQVDTGSDGAGNGADQVVRNCPFSQCSGVR